MTTTLITGANTGLGKETARQLVAAGHTVYVGARDEGRGRAAAEEVGARFVQLDVTDDASVAAAFAQIEADGGLDVLVNNAGIAKRTRTVAARRSTAPAPSRCSTPTRSASSGSPRRRCPCCAARPTRWS